MHYRRCELASASHVAIAVTSVEVDDTEVTFDESYIQGVRKFFTSFFWAFHEVFTFVFSDRNFFGCDRTSGSYFAVLPVLTDESGCRYIMFRFRRYNLAEDRFVPGVVDSYNMVSSIVSSDAATGLSPAEIHARGQLIGKNTIVLPKPSFLGCLYREVSKPFYTYQTFLVWSWIPVSVKDRSYGMHTLGVDIRISHALSSLSLQSFFTISWPSPGPS